MLRSAGLAATLVSLGITSMADAANLDSKLNFSIPAQTLSAALFSFAEQAGIQVMTATADLADIESPGVVGERTARDALSALLAGTGLRFRAVSDGAVTIEGRTKRADIRNTTGALPIAPASLRLAQAEVAPSADAAESGASPSPGLEEIIVTAQKRAEGVQSTPLSITALSSVEIDQRGLVGMADYLRTLPGVNQIDRGAGRNSVIMRGIAASPQSDGANAGPTVGVYLGDIPLTGYTSTGDSTDIKLVDMARVEVLRGPQGTLFGDSSLGGTVRNIPNAPDLQELTGNVSLTYSNTDKNGDRNTAAQGVINVPLVTDKLAIRLVGYDFEYGGFIDNIAGDTPAVANAAAAFGAGNLAVNEKSANEEAYRGGRAAVLWKPFDTFSASLTYLHQDMELDGLPEVQLNLPGKYEQARLRMGPAAGGGKEGLEDKVDIVHLELEKELGWASLVSSTSYIEEESEEDRDLAIFAGGIPFPQRIASDVNVFVQELRLASQLPGPLQFLTGLYYQDMDQDLGSDTLYGGEPSLNPFGTDPLYYGYGNETRLKQKALFGEVSYQIAGQFKLSVGGRLFDYERVTTQFRSEGIGAQGLAVPLAADEKNSIYRVNGSYRPTENALLYVQWAEGFRLGRAIPPITISGCDVNNDGLIDGGNISTGVREIQADTLDSYELGAKSSMLDRRVVLNAAIYRNEWKQLPVGLSFPCGATAVANAGTARSQGLEIESEFLLNDHLRVGLGGSYVDAKLTSDAVGLGQSGDRLPGSPKYNVNSSLTYSFPLSGHDAFVRGDFAYVGGYYNNLQETGIELGDYEQVNLRGGITLKRIDVEVLVNNVTNTSALTWTDTIFGGLDDRAVRLRPRTYGIRLGYTF